MITFAEISFLSPQLTSIRCPRAARNFSQITIGASSVVNAPSEEEWTNYVGATGGESQTVSLSNAELGTFTLTYDGQTMAAIDWDAATGDVETALEALSNIDDVSVNRCKML